MSIVTYDVVDPNKSDPTTEAISTVTGISEGKFILNLQFESVGRSSSKYVIIVESSSTVVIPSLLLTYAEPKVANVETVKVIAVL